jgi:hypothetical protein
MIGYYVVEENFGFVVLQEALPTFAFKPKYSTKFSLSINWRFLLITSLKIEIDNWQV